ncbi:HD-domain/PDEase-like protein [Caulochytrium protostelioides]|nr:HD-domain/PDEase-like protein [Caulochytrium protostelioides]
MLVVQEGYIATNPYHNSKHAADVLFCTHFYIRSPKIWPHLGPLDLLACIIAPLIHDYGHPGVNNAFLISTLDPLSLRYNDVAPLENYHAASVFDMMQSTELNLLETLPLESRRYVRDLVLTMVLATDMTAHFEWIGKFKTKLTSHTGFAYDQKTDKKLVLNMAIKATDINNAAKPNDLCVTWTNWCMEEFFLQGDQEKKRGMTVSMFMNRDNTDIPKCQIGFIDYIVTPLYEAWYAYLKEDMQAMMDNIDTNRQHWKKRVTT